MLCYAMRFEQNAFIHRRVPNISKYNNDKKPKFTINHYVFKFFGKEKIMKTPAGFELMAYRFEVDAQTHCATLLGKYVKKEKVLNNNF